MRILLAHNSLYYPSHGGGDKSNRLLMEALAARGHEVRVVARIEKFGPQPHARYLAQVEGLRPESREGVVRFTLGGVDVRTLTESPAIRAYFAAQVREFDPDVIVTSTDDPAQLLFDIALQAPRAKVVYLARATIAVPFGPDASSPSSARTAALRRASLVVGVSEYVARYVREHGGMPAVHVPISLMEPGEPEAVARFDNPYVTLANPCAVKGIDIFLALADALPDIAFAAVPTWGTNARDLAALQARPNIAIIPPVERMADLFCRTKVLLVPSLWAEARSRIVVEAMLHGVPVIASDIGGIPEAKLGVPYLLPVSPIRGYRAAVDENMVPVADVPPQDVGPWVAALRRLTVEEPHWTDISRQSTNAARAYLASLSVDPFEELLQAACRADVSPRGDSSPPVRAPQSLSEDRRKLLALRLRQKSATQWFPNLEPAGFRLFCFPHAGGGTLLYRSWQSRISGVTPACLPGREHRLREPAFEDMPELIPALADAISPHLNHPFAFFGHSMGAAIAFELARELQERKLPSPQALVVSAARAPRFRLNHVPGPDPTDEEFIAELRRLQGVPAELLDSPDAMRILLPVLKADARLYRRYVYRAGPRLGMPVYAYTGRADPNVRMEHIEPWREQTTGRFTVREFDGGHFYLHERRDEFLTVLAGDLDSVKPG